jgi:ABC-type phosphonate transport system ATPase subunit
LSDAHGQEPDPRGRVRRDGRGAPARTLGQRARRRRRTINRTDWGLIWQQKLAAGGMLVGEEVTILIDVSAVRT